MYDDVGCWGLSKSFSDKLKNAGVEVLKFAPVNSSPHLQNQLQEP